MSKPSAPPVSAASSSASTTSEGASSLTADSLQNMLAAYQQAASFAAAAYMYNPSLYSQIFGTSAGDTSSFGATQLQQKLLLAQQAQAAQQAQQQAALAASALASGDVNSLFALFSGSAAASDPPITASEAPKSTPETSTLMEDPPTLKSLSPHPTHTTPTKTITSEGGCAEAVEQIEEEDTGGDALDLSKPE